MTLHWLLSVIVIIILVAFSVPVKISIKSNLLCLVTWLFFTLIVNVRKNDVKVELRFLKESFLLTKNKSLDPSSVEISTEGGASRSRQTSYLSILKIIVGDSESRKPIYQICQLLFRFVKAFQIHSFKCKIGLKDYYSQGILTGLLCALPTNDNFQISGNFMEVNSFTLKLRMSLWKMFFALIIFITRFPYLEIFRFYRKIVHYK